MLLIPDVGETDVCGVGVVTGPVTVVSVETSPAGPRTTVLDPMPEVESVIVIRTVFAGRPRQSYKMVVGRVAGLMLVVAGGKV